MHDAKLDLDESSRGLYSMIMNRAAPTLGTFHVVDSKNMKARAQVFKTLVGAQSKAHHLGMCHGRMFYVARVVAA